MPRAPRPPNHSLSHARAPPKIPKALFAQRVEHKKSTNQEDDIAKVFKKESAEAKKITSSPSYSLSVREKAAHEAERRQHEAERRHAVLERVRNAARGKDSDELQAALQDAIECEAMTKTRAKALRTKWMDAQNAAVASAAQAARAEIHQKALMEARQRTRLAGLDGENADLRSGSTTRHTSSMSVASAAQSAASGLRELREQLATEEVQAESQRQRERELKELKKQTQETRLKEEADRLALKRKAKKEDEQLAKQQADFVLQQEETARIKREKERLQRLQREDAERRLQVIALDSKDEDLRQVGEALAEKATVLRDRRAGAEVVAQNSKDNDLRRSKELEIRYGEMAEKKTTSVEDRQAEVDAELEDVAAQRSHEDNNAAMQDIHEDKDAVRESHDEQEVAAQTAHEDRDVVVQEINEGTSVAKKTVGDEVGAQSVHKDNDVVEQQNYEDKDVVSMSFKSEKVAVHTTLEDKHVVAQDIHEEKNDVRESHGDEQVTAQAAHKETDAKNEVVVDTAAIGEQSLEPARRVFSWPSLTMVQALLRFRGGGETEKYSKGLYQKVQKTIDWKRVLVLVEHGSSTSIGFSNQRKPCLFANRTVGSSVEDVLTAEGKLSIFDQKGRDARKRLKDRGQKASLPDLEPAGSRRHPVLVVTRCSTSTLKPKETRNPRSGCQVYDERNCRESIANERLSLGNVGVCFANSAVLALLASGKRSGILIRMGDQMTEVVPVYEGSILHSAVQVSGCDVGVFSISGLQVTEQFESLVTARRRQADLRAATIVKESFGRVAFHFRHELEQHKAFGRDRCGEVIKLSKLDLSGDPLKSKSLMDQFAEDLNSIELFLEPFLLTERVIFNPRLPGVGAFEHSNPFAMALDKYHPGLPELVKYAVEAVDFQIRRLLLRNVLLSGGGSRFPGLRDRLHMELANIFPVEFDVNVEVAPIEKDEKQRTITPEYQGALLLARSPSFRSKCITKDDFDQDESLAQWLHG